MPITLHYSKNYADAFTVRLNDVYAMQSCVERVIGKRTPEYRQFNEAIRNASDSKVAKAHKTIERTLQ